MQECILEYHRLLARLNGCVSAPVNCIYLNAQHVHRGHIPSGYSVAVASDQTAWILSIDLQAVSTVTILHVFSSSPLHEP